MKQIPLKFKLMALILFLSNSHSHAVINISRQCPDRFIGTVRNIADSKAPFSSKAQEKLKVSLHISKTIRGSIYQDKDIQILKHGPQAFEVGKTYIVELNNGFLCSAKVM